MIPLFRSAPWLRNTIRTTNKYVANPLIGLVAGEIIFAQAYHRGRRSGRQYATPVVAEPTSDGFAIPLPYGSDIDWCYNVLETGRFAIRWRGRVYILGLPEIVPFSQVAPAFPLPIRLASQVAGIEECLLAYHIQSPIASLPDSKAASNPSDQAV